MTRKSGAVRASVVKADADLDDETAIGEQQEKDGIQDPDAQAECRRRSDRRTGSWKSIIYGNFKPRRRDHRRSADEDYFWFDWHEPRILYLALGILLLSCIDALFTLNLINAGADEANPVMASMLEVGLENFVAGKITITSLSVIILVVLARRTFVGRFSVEHVLQTVFTGYIMLICYEIYMFWYVFDLSISPAWLQQWLIPHQA